MPIDVLLACSLGFDVALVSVPSPPGQQEGEQVAGASCDAIWGGGSIPSQC